MKAREHHPSAVDTQFDEWAKAVAHGLTRRKTLQLIGGTFTGAFLALRGSKAWATPSPGTQGCGHICAPPVQTRATKRPLTPAPKPARIAKAATATPA